MSYTVLADSNHPRVLTGRRATILGKACVAKARELYDRAVAIVNDDPEGCKALIREREALLERCKHVARWHEFNAFVWDQLYDGLLESDDAWLPAFARKARRAPRITNEHSRWKEIRTETGLFLTVVNPA